MKRFIPLLAGEGAVAAPPVPAAPAGAPPEGGQPGAAPPAAAAAPKPEGPKVDANQMASFAKDFLGKHFEGQPEKPPEGAPKVEPKPGEPGAAAPAAPAKPKTKPKAAKVEPRIEPPVPVPPALTPEQIAQAAAKGVAQAMAPGTGTAPKGELNPVEERRMVTLQHMERMYPEKYVGLAERYKASMLELQNYSAKWEQEHPGQPFDESAEEHEQFFAKHDVDWEDDDYTEAVADIRTTAALAEERKGNEQRMSKLERTERIRQAGPDIGAHQTAGATVFWRNTTAELADVIKADGTVDTAKLEEAKKKDPIGYAFRVNAANALNREIAELYTVMNGMTDFNPKDPVHVEMGSFATRMERDLSRRAEDDKRDAEGRMFVPAERYWSAVKEKGKAYVENYFWTFSPAELAALRAHSLANEIEKNITAEHQRQQEYALAMGWKPPEGQEIVQVGTAETGAPSPAAGGSKPESPGGAAESRMHANKTAGAGGAQDFNTSFFKKQMGQS